MDEATQTKLNSMHGDILGIKEQLVRMNSYQREDHDRITRLEERMKFLHIAQAAYNTIASALAVWLGRG